MKNNPLYHLARLGLTETSPTNGTLEVLKIEGIALGEVIAQLSDEGWSSQSSLTDDY